MTCPWNECCTSFFLVISYRALRSLKGRCPTSTGSPMKASSAFARCSLYERFVVLEHRGVFHGDLLSEIRYQQGSFDLEQGSKDPDHFKSGALWLFFLLAVLALHLSKHWGLR